jgi:hypothetical protein
MAAFIANRPVRLADSPTITSGSAYASGQSVGGLRELAHAQTGPLHLILQSVVVADASITTTIADNAFHAMTGIWVNGTDGVLYVDGAPKVTGSTLSTSSGTTGIQLGGVSGSVLDGVITEALYLSNSVSDAQAAALNANARAYYGF